MKTYMARSFGSATVVDTERPSRALDPKLDLRNHSPTGLSWGYSGSGCAQFALAILADLAGDEVALKYYQRFKERAIATANRDEPFIMTDDNVLEHLMAIDPEVKL